LNATKSKSNRDPLYVFCLIGAAMFSAYGLAQDLSPEIRADVDRRINLQRKWDERNNSPGAELQAVVVLRADKVLKYELRAKDLPLDLKYELLILPTMASSINELTSTGDVEIDKQDGRVLDGPGDVRSMFLAAPAPGEPYRFALVSKDRKYKAFATVLPNPIEATEKGCRVRVIRLMPKFELAFVQFTGFPPQAEIDVHGNSEGEILDFKLKTNADGYVDTGILPFKAGKSRGTMNLQTSTPKCSPKVSFRWGSTE
jgi:hypothetical protein